MIITGSLPRYQNTSIQRWANVTRRWPSVGSTYLGGGPDGLSLFCLGVLPWQIEFPRPWAIIAAPIISSTHPRSRWLVINDPCLAKKCHRFWQRLHCIFFPDDNGHDACPEYKRRKKVFRVTSLTLYAVLSVSFVWFIDCRRQTLKMLPMQRMGK